MQDRAGILAEFRAAVNDPLAYAGKAVADGRRAIGFFCSYAPEEIIQAAGFLPVRLFGSHEHVDLADGYLQSYCCSLLRGALEDGLAGRLDFLDGMVFPHTCDSIQRLSDIWRINLQRDAFFADVVLPVNLSSDSSRVYLEAVLAKFREELAAWKGQPITEADLREAIRLYNQIRSAMRELYELRSKRPGLLSSGEMHAVIRGSMVMDRYRALDLLQMLLKDLSRAQDGETDALRVLLSGSVCDEPRIFDVVEKAGATVIWDDLCTGSRYFDSLIRENRDPIPALADRHIRRQLCPAKYKGPNFRLQQLLQSVKDHDAAGVVFLLLKFCDPHAFDYPDLKELLEKNGVPVLLLEIEDRLPPEGQLATRLETFVQMIGGE